MSKREEIRAKRAKQAMTQRLMVVGGVILIAAAVAWALIAPNFAPVGEVVIPEFSEYPQLNGRELGDPNNPVLIEVFEDFQCPACARYTEQVEPLVIEQFVATGQARYIFRNFPFIDGPGYTGGESDTAAMAAMCAIDQGKFWEMHSVIYANWSGENQNAFSDRRLKAMAETLGLDTTAFNDCFDGETYKAEIQEDYQRGLSLGVTGTPSVFVNGVQVTPGFIPSINDIALAVQQAQP